MGTDSRLIAEARAGSMAAREALFGRYWRRVWRTAYVISASEDLANDIAQDTFIRAFASLAQFDETRAFGPWITRIAANRTLDVIRRERRSIPQDRPDTAEAQIERDWELVDAVRRLAPDRRAVIGLHYWLDLHVAEISEILELPPGTVASRLSRALKELRHELEAQYV